jgi:hypothetical protein
VGALSGCPPERRGELWAEIDRALVDQAPNVWLANPIAVEFVSERVGNYQYSQQWGSLLDQLGSGIRSLRSTPFIEFPP